MTRYMDAFWLSPSSFPELLRERRHPDTKRYIASMHRFVVFSSLGFLVSIQGPFLMCPTLWPVHCIWVMEVFMDAKSFGPAGEKPLDDKSLLVKSSLEIENTWKLIGRYGVPCIISLLGCLLLLFLYLECGNVHIVYPYQQKAFPTFLQ